MIDVDKLKAKIDERNKYCNQIYTKQDSNEFQFDGFINETMEMARSINYYDGYCLAKMLSAIRLMGFGQYEEAYAIIQDILNEKPLEELELKCQMKLYTCMMSYHSEFTGNYEMAIKASKKELEAAYNLNDINEIMRIKMNLASLNIRLKYYDTALDFLNETREYYESTNNELLLAYSYLHLGELYFEKEEYDLAEEYFDMSYKTAKEQHNGTMIQYTTIGLGKVEKALHNYAEAIEYLSQAILHCQEIESFQDEVEARLELFNVYMESSDYEAGFKELSYIEEHLDQLKNSEMTMMFYKGRAEVCYQLGKDRLAYESLQKYIKLKDALTDSSSHQIMNNMIQEEHEKALNQLKSIAAVGKNLTILQNIDDVMLNIKNELSKVLCVDVIGVGYYIDNLIHYNHFYINEEKAQIGSRPLNKDDSLASWCILHDKEVIINDLNREYSDYVKEVDFVQIQDENKDININSLMYSPLKVNDEIIGVFTIQSTEKNSYSSVEVNIFQIIVDYVAIAVKNIEQRLELERLSIKDNLTDLYNRRGFIDSYQKYIEGHKSGSIALLMLDLDYFKSTNDEFGHTVGDEVLKAVGTILKSKETTDIYAGRLGGEEFGIMLCNHSFKKAKNLAEEIRMDIENMSLEVGEKSIRTTVSIGVTYREFGDMKSYDQLYYEADNALYKAKDKGRNRIEIYE